MVLSLQGCMAAGKTTAARYLQRNASYFHVSLEDNAGVIAEVKKRGLDKGSYGDYLEIQRLWLNKEIARWREAEAYPCTVMDFGAEEIEFYTLHYPQTIGKSWEIETALKPELEALRKCLPDRILFLDASEDTLRRRKEKDGTRAREFFEHYVQKLLPLKRAWFIGRENVDVLCVDGLTEDEVGKRVKAWCGIQLAREALGNESQKTY